MDSDDDQPKRKAPRYRVHLSVRYELEHEPVRAHAENLSLSGVFVRGDGSANLGDRVFVDIDLPSYGAFRLEARVAHVIDSASAEAHGRAPGLGLSFENVPEEFPEALTGYLERLERRAEVMVLVADDRVSAVLAGAGYQVRPLPDADLRRAIADSEPRIIGLVVAESEKERVRAELSDVGSEGPVVVSLPKEGIDPLLEALDRVL